MHIPIIAYPHFRFDNVEMSARKHQKRTDLHRKQQLDWEEYYQVKAKDNTKSRQSIQHYNHVKDIEEIKAYESLKKHIEYGMYRYNTSLGKNLDVYV